LPIFLRAQHTFAQHLIQGAYTKAWTPLLAQLCAALITCCLPDNGTWRSRSALAQLTAHHPLFKLFLSLILRDRSPCGGEFPGTFDSFLLLTHIIVPRLLLLLSCCCPPLLLRSLLLLSSLSFPFLAAVAL